MINLYCKIYITMDKLEFIDSFRASCGSSGCDIKEYVILTASTKEQFEKELERAKEAFDKANKK